MYKSLEDYDEAAIYYDKALQVYEDVYSYPLVSYRHVVRIISQH